MASSLTESFNPFGPQKRAVNQIILWCSAAWLISFIAEKILGAGWLLQWLMFTPAAGRLLLQPWSIISYIFLHDGFWHLLTNMLWLYFVGTILEDMTGRKHIWRLFIAGGVAGALAYFVYWQLAGTGAGDGIPFMVGASGGVTAVIIGTATLFPRYRVMLFGLLPIDLAWIAIIRVGFDLLGASGPINKGGYICHLGGAALGLLYMLHVKGTITIPLVDRLSGWLSGLSRSRRTKPMRNIKVEINRQVNERPVSHGVSQEEIDRILDKINASGYDSLTSEEKARLFKAGE